MNSQARKQQKSHFARTALFTAASLILFCGCSSSTLPTPEETEASIATSHWLDRKVAALFEPLIALRDETGVLIAEAYREAEEIRGEGDAKAAEIYANAYGKNQEFYAFTRSLKAYQESFQGGSDVLLLAPDSEFFDYFDQARD